MTLKSEKIVVQSPMSFVGSAARAWKIARAGNPYPETGSFVNKLLWVLLKILLVSMALIAITVWWAAIVCWYIIFGILVIPWRLIRRGQRKRKMEALRHQEMLDVLKKK